MVLRVGDRVKSRATLYDVGTEDEDGLTFSQRQLGKGLGAFCFGEVTHVYRKLGRQSQKDRMKWDNGEVSPVLHEHLELVSVVEPGWKKGDTIIRKPTVRKNRANTRGTK